jgi:hypothetical protein
MQLLIDGVVRLTTAMSPALLLSPVNMWPDGKNGPKLTFEETILIIGFSRPRRVAAFLGLRG